jgi:hypothetical protein
MPETRFLYSTGFSKLRLVIFLTILFLPFSGNILYAQDPVPEDTASTEEVIDLAKLDSAYHNPQKAALFSAVLPGLGQVYNKKYWKVPIIYASFVSLGYLIKRNSKEYKLWRQAYIDYPDYKLDYSYPLSLEQINLGKDFYKRQKELSIIATAGFYILQIIDATVDAYLFDWSVGEDLSLKVEPSILNTPAFPNLPPANTFGLRACLSF